MSYDVAFRHDQALDPAAFATIATALHALTAAIGDCRNAGKDIEADPAILLLARHLGDVATRGKPGATELRRVCMDSTAEIRRNPLLLLLARRGVGYPHFQRSRLRVAMTQALRSFAGSIPIPATVDNAVTTPTANAAAPGLANHPT